MSAILEDYEHKRGIIITTKIEMMSVCATSLLPF